MAVLTLHSRPLPPARILDIDATSDGIFVPAPEVEHWIRDAFLDPAGPLYFEGHEHLRAATLGVLWTTAENIKSGRRIVGQAEMPERGGGGAWSKARAAQQRRTWFGQDPTFLITLDAFYCDGADDAQFAALVDHELCHCAPKLDDFGSPKFNQQTGEPMFTIRGHDVEEFVSVVSRFGIEAAGEAATDLVIAAARRPEIAPARLAQACGTCRQRAA